MCALARYCLQKGYEVSGSDAHESPNVQRLKSLGARVSIGHKAENVKNAEVLVCSKAVLKTNDEIVYAKEKGLPVFSREEFLGKIFNEYSQKIAVCGAHGKTTVTALLEHVFEQCDCQATSFVGGNTKTKNSFVCGDIAICEACEYENSFHTLEPTVGVCLNVEHDHPDFFKTKEQLEKGYLDFFKKCQKAILLHESVKLKPERAIVFGQGLGCCFQARDVVLHKNGQTLDFFEKGEFVCKVHSNLVGSHNTANLTAVLAVARLFELPVEKVKKAIATFGGVERRWEKKECSFTNIIEDYAHHPSQVQKSIETGHLLGYDKLFVFFQPHTYSRTSAFFWQYCDCLKGADFVGISKIYPARETDPCDGFTSQKLCCEVEKSVPCKYFDNFEQIAEFIKKNCTKQHLVLLLGAGDNYKIYDLLKN